ncbi:hypothetical protein [Persephonella sp.]
MTTSLKEKKKTRKIPKELVYEMRYGSPIYYRDYDKVFSGEKTLEEVKGSSDLQAFLVTVLVSFLHSLLDKKKLLVLSNEVGYRFAPRSWYNLDIAVVNRKKIKKLTGNYITSPPELVIEINTKADTKKFQNPQDYLHMKT